MSKYKNELIIEDNISFSSKFEAKMYLFLKEWQNQNKISNLFLQEIFLLQEAFECPYYDGSKEKINSLKHREITYKTDFSFIYANYKVVLETKGFPDQKYPLKKKMFLKKYGNDILFVEIHRIREIEKIEEIINELIKIKRNLFNYDNI